MIFWHSSYASVDSSELTLTKIIYGASFEARPLVGYKFFKKGKFKTRKAIVLSEGVHGNEYLGLLDGFIEDFKKNKSVSVQMNNFLNQGGIILFAPQVNPDGVSKKRRLTSFGTDLNRDFDLQGIQMQESSLLSKWVEKELSATNAQLLLAIDYHCCAGALVHPEGNDSYSKYYQDALAMLNKPNQKKIKLGLTQDFFDKKNFGTLKDYWFQKYGTISLTFEATSMKKGDLVFSRHFKWWSNLVAYLDDAPTSLQLDNLASQSPESPEPVQSSYSE